MVHNMVMLRSLLVSSEGIRGPGVASHPNPVADASRPYPESPTDTNSCPGKSLDGELGEAWPAREFAAFGHQRPSVEAGALVPCPS